jgi:hypothetical protein
MSKGVALIRFLSRTGAAIFSIRTTISITLRQFGHPLFVKSADSGWATKAVRIMTCY